MRLYSSHPVSFSKTNITIVFKGLYYFYSMEIGERIRQARIAAGLSQTRLADLLGVTRSACSQWESEEGTSPRGKRLVELARLLDVSYEWLATGRDGSDGREVDGNMPPSYARTLNAQHKQLIIHFESLPATAQSALLRLLESISDVGEDDDNRLPAFQAFDSYVSSDDDENRGADS